jgi:hypothetical protein
MMDIGVTSDASRSQSKKPASKELGENFQEWIIQNDTGKKNLYGTGSIENISYPRLMVATSQYPGQQFKNFRYPWEAFSDVGFRCVISLRNKHRSVLSFYFPYVANGRHYHIIVRIGVDKPPKKYHFVSE